MVREGNSIVWSKDIEETMLANHKKDCPKHTEPYCWECQEWLTWLVLRAT